MMAERPMSFSDRQYFIQSLAVARNLSVECSNGEREGSELHQRCREMNTAIDAVVGELVGDASYLHLKEAQHSGLLY